MVENCKFCKFIDMDKVKIKTDANGKETYWYWCKSRKQYIQLDLYICNNYKLNKELIESLKEDKINGSSRSRKK